MTEKHFKNATTRLQQAIKNGNIPKNGGRAETLQLLSHILYNKPYEEVKETELKSKETQKENSVVLIRAGEESDIFVNGELFRCNIPNTDNHINEREFFELAQSLSYKFNTSLEEYTIPIADIDYFDTESIIKRAQQMGLLSKNPSLFKKLMCNNNVAIFVNHIHCPFGLDSDWLDNLENRDPSENIEEQVIWYIELKEGDDLFEYFITFGDLCKAEYLGQNEWKLYDSLSDTELLVTIKK